MFNIIFIIFYYNDKKYFRNFMQFYFSIFSDEIYEDLNSYLIRPNLAIREALKVEKLKEERGQQREDR